MRVVFSFPRAADRHCIQGYMMRLFAILCVFIVLAVGFSWPLPLHLDTALDNDFDTLMFASVLQFFRANVLRHPRDLFDAPFYHPHRQTLPSVFHNYMVGLAYIPLYALTRSPVGSYNILHLLTLALDAFAMYILVRHLTGGELPAIVSGAIFGFCPVRTANFQYTPFVTNYWVVFAILLLFKFSERLSRGGAPGFTLLAGSLALYLVQCLSDMVGGLYLGLAFFPVLAFGLLANLKRLGPGGLARAAAMLALLALCLAAATAPLRAIRKGMGEERVAWDAETVQEICPAISSYLSPSPGNILYGRATAGFSLNARQVNFFGAAAWILAAIGFFAARKTARFLPAYMPPLALAICLAAFLLSLGPWICLTPGVKLCPGPSMLVYRFFPALRTLGGLGMVVLVYVCVMAGFGVQWLADRLQSARLCRRGVLGAGLLAILTIEYASYPPTTWGEPFYCVPRTPPAVYRWLMAQRDTAPVIELPMPWEPEEIGGALGLDTAAMYWAAFHGRRIVNGQTAFAYPEYKIIADQMKRFPSRETIDILRSLGVRYVVLHVGRLPRLEWQWQLVRAHPEAAYDWRATLDRLDRFGGELALRVKAGGDRLYEILPGPSAPAIPPGAPLPRHGWTATAYPHPSDASLAINGREETAWSTRHNQVAGLFFQLDLGRREKIAGIGMILKSANECPKNPRVEISNDGRRWTPVDYGGAYLDFTQRLIADPGEKLFRISFPAVKTRYIRMTLTRMDNLYPWTIAELEVYGGV